MVASLQTLVLRNQTFPPRPELQNESPGLRQIPVISQGQLLCLG